MSGKRIAAIPGNRSGAIFVGMTAWIFGIAMSAANMVTGEDLRATWGGS